MLTSHQRDDLPRRLRVRDAALGFGFALLATIALTGSLLLLAALAPSAEAAETSLRIAREETSPGKVFYRGTRAASFRFETTGRRTHDVRVQLVRRSNREVLRSWTRRNVKPGETRGVRWNGSRPGGGHAPGGEYFFRLRQVGGGKADRTRAKGSRRIVARHHKFPVRGRHSYGDGMGAGRGHQGQDVFARCGTKLVAARAGRVKHRGYHSAAGHYLVIDGTRSKLDYVYMHLKRKPRVRTGQRVRTGEVLGRVGATGNASGCHLHFELWSAPGWYEGGSPKRSVTKKLRRWDRWS